ncbi:MAG: methyltransferase domain-containing protein [Candidatus Omnitrophica bacterium]|nr:methyltransferase domain-containing protein [Candidatus Omnitrophota bacterium]
MSSDSLKSIWQKSWQQQLGARPEDILYTRFTKKAFRNFKRFIDRSDKLILEAGCGTGRLCCLLGESFANSMIVGIDITQESLDIANKLKQYLRVENVEFKKGDIFSLNYPDGYFDVVFNNGVIEHFSLDQKSNYNHALEEMLRVLKPGGKIIIDVPNWYCFAHTFYKWLLKITGRKYSFGYEKSFKRTELIALFKAQGLVEIQLRGYDFAHGVYRLQGNHFLIRLLADILYLIENPILENLFGFMLLIKAEKPLNKQ